MTKRGTSWPLHPHSGIWEEGRREREAGVRHDLSLSLSHLLSSRREGLPTQPCGLFPLTLLVSLPPHPKTPALCLATPNFPRSSLCDLASCPLPHANHRASVLCSAMPRSGLGASARWPLTLFLTPFTALLRQSPGESLPWWCLRWPPPNVLSPSRLRV